MTKAKNVIASLTEEQKQFYQHKTISDTRKIKDWIVFFAGISVLDKLGDEKRSNLKSWAIFCLFFAFVFILLTVNLDEPYYPFGIGVFIIIAIVLFYRRFRLKKNDISNYLRLFFVPVLQVLREKAGPEARLAATLDFHDIRNHEPVKSKVGVRKQSLYTAIYMLGRVQLLDEVKLQFGVQDELRDQKWTTTSMSGKTKWKSKTKTTNQILIKMLLPKAKYAWNGSEERDLEVQEKADHYEAKKKIKIKHIGENELSNREFFAAIQSVYAQFTPLDEQAQREHQGEGRESQEDDGVYMAPYVWYGGYFDHYDYDSVDYQDGTEMSYEEEENSVFDS